MNYPDISNGFLVLWYFGQFKSNQLLHKFLEKVSCPAQELCHISEIDIYKVTSGSKFLCSYFLVSFLAQNWNLASFPPLPQDRRTNESFQIYFET